VKPSEYPEQDARTVPFQSETKEAVLAHPAPEPRTRYLDLPPSPEARGVTRNLAWGIALLALAAIAFWLGLHYAGAAATRTLVACLLTFGVVWLLLHLNVLRQRYGGLFGLGLVAFIGAAIPFVEGGFRRLDGLARR
jgi:Flp pilus assembly protein TadB